MYDDLMSEYWDRIREKQGEIYNLEAGRIFQVVIDPAPGNCFSMRGLQLGEKTLTRGVSHFSKIA